MSSASETMAATLGGLPAFWPALLLATVASAAVAGPLGRLLAIPAWRFFLLLGSFGLVAAATLTPAPVSYFLPGHASTCETGSFTIPSLGQLAYVSEVSLNVALFVPLGVACLLLPRWGQVGLAAILAFATPWTVEAVQYLVPSLDRVCSTDDIAANLTGLVIGFIGGLLVLRPLLQPLVRPVPESEPVHHQPGHPSNHPWA